MYPTSKKLAIRTLSVTLLLALSAAGNTFAAQVLEGKQGETLSASVSRTEPTLIQIAGHRVRNIFGTAGEFTVTPDKLSGSAYLKPVTDKPAFNIFVTDENGHTWNLLLSVVNGPSDIITIKEPGVSIARAARKGHDLPREESIKQMLFALMGHGGDEDEDTQKMNETIPLWAETHFVRVKITKGNSLVGEKYELTNLSNKPLDIDERDLYRKGVVAVSVRKPYLQPSETTDVFVISNKTEAE